MYARGCFSKYGYGVNEAYKPSEDVIINIALNNEL